MHECTYILLYTQIHIYIYMYMYIYISNTPAHALPPLAVPTHETAYTSGAGEICMLISVHKMCACMRAHIYTYIHTYIYIYIDMCICTHIYLTAPRMHCPSLCRRRKPPLPTREEERAYNIC